MSDPTQSSAVFSAGRIRDTASWPTHVAGGRFELVRCLGQGAFGTVFEAYDHAAGDKVALKMLDRAHGDALLRFKREFRALHGIRHPNLVELRELIQCDGRWLLTMELVEGEDFLSYTRPAANAVRSPGSHCDEARLRRALSGLAKGLAALHAEGCVHRDIKPSNVRVTAEGRVVLLDFGLVTGALDSLGASRDALGTPAYMAPEQAAAGELGPPADWYAMGVMLFEALTGQLPFDGSPLHVMMAKQEKLALEPRDLASDVPEDLNKLAVALLAHEPGERPGAARVFEALLEPVAHREPRQPVLSYLHFPVTRLDAHAGERELRAAFARTRKGALATAIVSGGQPLLRTQIIDATLERLSAEIDGLIVLRGRCYEQESVPCKGLDGVVDALSRALRRMQREECQRVLPRRAGLLPQMFPVLARVPVIAQLEGMPVRLERAALDPLIRAGLRELFGRLADHRPLVVCIDELGWADLESITLLADILAPPDPPPMLLVVSTSERARIPAHVHEGLLLIAGADPEHTLVELK